MKQQNPAVEINKSVYTIHGKKRCKILSFNSKERVPKKNYPDCYGIFRAKESTTPAAFPSVWDVGDGDLISNPQVFQGTDVEFHPGTIRLDVFEGIRPDGKTRGVESLRCKNPHTVADRLHKFATPNSEHATLNSRHCDIVIIDRLLLVVSAYDTY